MTAKFGNMWNSLSILPGASNWTPHQLRYKSNAKTSLLLGAIVLIGMKYEL